MLDLSICIVTQNHKRFIKDCLESIETIQNVCYEILLLDNCSSDGIADLVRNNFTNVHFFENSTRYGFAKNNNILIEKSKGKYLLLLNPDTVIKNDAIERLMKFMEENHEAGICGPKLLFPDEKLQLSCRKFPTLKSTLIRRTPIRNFLPYEKRGSDHLMSNWDHNATIEVDWLLGACLMIRRQAILEVGLVDENFPLYCEDIDLCLRMKQKNWKIYYVHDAIVIHHHLAESDKKFFSRKTYLHFKSMLYFLKKHWYSKSILFRG